MRKGSAAFGTVCILLAVAILANVTFLSQRCSASGRLAQAAGGDFIQWVSFDPPYAALEKALQADIDSQESEVQISWVEVLASLAAKYWGEWDRYRAKDMDALLEELRGGASAEELSAQYKYYPYYLEAYTAVLGGMVGDYQVGTGGSQEEPVMEENYGLKAYSPIAYGYGFSHYDDFGNSRSYGYRRKHLGNDLLASVGTPVVAVESGIITHLGWNQYGGWRIGIRSLDGKRYYYYAHLRKGHPYASHLTEGTLVNAGDLIGYVGMTGYSTKEDVDGMTVAHLHFGMQLIFDPSQEEGENEIWIDVYNIVKLLEKHKSPVVRPEGAQDYVRKYPFSDPAVEDYLSRQT